MHLCYKIYSNEIPSQNNRPGNMHDLHFKVYSMNFIVYTQYVYTNWKYCYSPEPPNTSCCCPEPPAQAGNIVTVLGLPTPAAAALSPQHQLEILLLSWAIPNISCCCLTPAAAALDP